MNAVFALESPCVLRIEVDGAVWMKPGAAIAYRGEVSFVRRPTSEATTAADVAMRELVPVVRAAGRGQLYCGWHGSHFRIVRLAGQRMVVAAEELIAFDDSLAFQPGLVAHGVGVAAGGLLAITLEGDGSLAIGVHSGAVTLPVTTDAPVHTDPLATVAWSGDLDPELRTDLTWRSLVGHGGHEAIQMRFAGTGDVLVQPFKDERRWHPEHLLRAFLKALVPLP